MTKGVDSPLNFKLNRDLTRHGINKGNQLTRPLPTSNVIHGAGVEKPKPCPFYAVIVQRIGHWATNPKTRVQIFLTAPF